MRRAIKARGPEHAVPRYAQRLCRLSVAAALGRDRAVRRELGEALKSGIPLNDIREAFLQLYLLAGFPRMINAFLATEDLCGPAPVVEGPRPRGALLARGRRLCRRIYGSQFGPMLKRMGRLHPELADWIVSEGYGKVLSRRFLKPDVRELMSICILGAQGNFIQFFSHIRGARHLGVSRGAIRNALRACAPWITPSRLDRSLSCLK